MQNCALNEICEKTLSVLHFSNLGLLCHLVTRMINDNLQHSKQTS